MKHRPIKAWPAACALALALAAQAADPIPFDIKPGLWEMSDAGSKVTGEIPDAMVAGVPPAQREQMKAQMLAGFATKAKSDKNCITEEDLKRGLQEESQDSCKILTKSISAAGYVLSEVCADEHGRSTLKVHFRRVSREQIAGNISIAMDMGGQTLTIEQSIKGRWLGAACGNVGKKWSPR